MTTTQTITISDRNESKYLLASGFEASPRPKNPFRLDFDFVATDALFEARRDYSLNRPVPVQSFISASEQIDRLIVEHRQRATVRVEAVNDR